MCWVSDKVQILCEYQKSRKHLPMYSFIKNNTKIRSVGKKDSVMCWVSYKVQVLCEYQKSRKHLYLYIVY
ncbi:hypothetical protein EDL79_03855 [Ehrlichia ruminantium]|uniref:Uncharacterized protein n=1 Tax=Ehrlichia ruminantium TaxID=779 RepID=A0AAE6UIQ2_EHRRU|nr:hypothetical protein [Ehrlichia ruminantium]QGR02750.1 hypothetical protein EDL81_03845 [Ehrlichia ruminantium]QGR03670.1 hypothetical protein EDL80_03845 [Ehrlichia ruminantium]QGR04597.1 hypothetical protein EDL79_03855 [Ehrlichia ruminantium]